MSTRYLTQLTDGLDAVDLGIIGNWQYALTFFARDTAAEVMRRRADEVGTYGGWRWECGSGHPKRHPEFCPGLAARIDAAIVQRRKT